MARKTICVDLDGVLARYDEWKGIDHIGIPNPGAVEFTKALSKFARVVIFTTRCKVFPPNAPGPEGNPEPGRDDVDLLTARVEAWLNLHGFWYDEVYAGQGKPLAAGYIDDRAVLCEPQAHKGAFAAALARTQFLCEGK